MKKLFLRLSYLGTPFCGYQVQRSGVPTVQEKLNEAARSLFGYDCDITGCSRTDSGVHANDFCITVSEKGKDGIATSIPLHKIPQAMNVRLPSEISVRYAAMVDSSFHPRYDVKSKEYVYLIYNGRYRDPFLEGRAYFLPKELSDEAVASMNAAAQMLIGEHDFSSYMAAGSKVEDTVRNMMSASVERDGDIVRIRLEANGFLYNMVRIIAGTLLDVGEGRLAPDAVAEITDACDRSLAGATLPAHGLYLNRVNYENIE